MTRALLVCLTMIITIFTFSITNEIYAVEQTQENIVSLYCWSIAEFNLSKLKDEVEYLNINTLYIQRPYTTSEIERLKQIMEFAKLYDIDVFLLDGDCDWLTTEENIIYVKELIDVTKEINESLDYKIKGVSVDVEFYGADDYAQANKAGKIELFKIFTAKTKECCDYANSLGLEYSMALPIWLDVNLDSGVLEDLMNYNYDHILFMNYYKPKDMTNLDQEIEYAKKHNIKIVTAAEVTRPEDVGIDATESFYYDGLQSCIDSLNAIKAKYNYEKLGISYHYYKPLIELLERDTDVGIEDRYELEVYPYKDDESIKVNEAVISGDGITFEPIHGYYSEAGEYVINFYGLEYGKEYTLTVRNGLWKGTKTFTYEKENDDVSELEIAYTDIQLSELMEEEIFTSKIYKIGPDYISRIAPRTIFSEFMQNIETNQEITVTNKEGNTIGKDMIFATGMIVKVGTKSQYIIAVKGDVDQDGDVDFQDILQINKHRLEKERLEGINLIAGDIDEDGKVDFQDILQINKYRLEKIDNL